MADKKEKKLVLNKAWCKGCGICVAFCPKGVLGMQGDKVAVLEEAKCIKCGFCELRCPDYAIWLEEVK